MTVEELINELQEVDDKQKDVKLSILIGDDETYDNTIVDIKEQQLSIYIYNW